MGSENLINESDFIKLLAYIVSSAKGCIDEPKIYGSFRLIDTVSKLFHILKDNNVVYCNEISKIIDKIDKKKYSFIANEKEFIDMLDEAIDSLVDLVQSKN